MNDKPGIRFEVFHPDLDEFVDSAYCLTQEDAEFLVKEMDKTVAGHKWRLVMDSNKKVV